MQNGANKFLNRRRRMAAEQHSPDGMLSRNSLTDKILEEEDEEDTEVGIWAKNKKRDVNFYS